MSVPELTRCRSEPARRHGDGGEGGSRVERRGGVAEPGGGGAGVGDQPADGAAAAGPRGTEGNEGRAAVALPARGSLSLPEPGAGAVRSGARGGPGAGAASRVRLPR